MIHVGYEFELDRAYLRQYSWDYMVAMTAAALPWIFAALYFVFVMLPAELQRSWEAWKEALLPGRFAAPTSVTLIGPASGVNSGLPLVWIGPSVDPTWAARSARRCARSLWSAVGL